MKNFRYLVLSILIMTFGISGCATITGTSRQSLSVQALEQSGKELKGAACEVSNGKGMWFITSPGSAEITRSHDDLNVICNKEGYEPGRAEVRSSIKAAMFGNVFFVFFVLIGAGVDHISGAAYEYPQLIQVMMGSFRKIEPTGSKDNSSDNFSSTPGSVFINAPN